MATEGFINLPVKNMEKSNNFFEELGYEFNPQFTDEKAACMIISDTIHAMLLKEDYFQTFTKKEVSDARKCTEVLIAIDAASKEEVQKIISKAKKLGATIYSDAADHGWMYQHRFTA